MEWFEKLAGDKNLVEHAKIVKKVNSGDAGAFKNRKSLSAIAANGYKNHPLSAEDEAKAQATGEKNYGKLGGFKRTALAAQVGPINAHKKERGETNLLQNGEDVLVNQARTNQWADSVLVHPEMYGGTAQLQPRELTPIMPEQTQTAPVQGQVPAQEPAPAQPLVPAPVAAAPVQAPATTPAVAALPNTAPPAYTQPNQVAAVPRTV